MALGGGPQHAGPTLGGTNTVESIFVDPDAMAREPTEACSIGAQGNSEEGRISGQWRSGDGFSKCPPEGVWKLAGLADLARKGLVLTITTPDQPGAISLTRAISARGNVRITSSPPRTFGAAAQRLAVLGGGGIPGGRPRRCGESSTRPHRIKWPIPLSQSGSGGRARATGRTNELLSTQVLPSRRF